MAFYFMFNIPGIGIVWLNYILPISMAVTVPLAILVKDTYKRSDLDVNNSSGRKTPEGLSRADSTIDIRQVHLRFE
jgi:hypothetical protein